MGAELGTFVQHDSIWSRTTITSHDSLGQLLLDALNIVST
jgi:hypothetical protein